MNKYDNTFVIGFCGKARSGKDTAAGYVAGELGGEVRAMAGILKSMLHPLLASLAPLYVESQTDFARACLYGDLKEEIVPSLGASPRELMQTLGTEWARGMVNDQLWVIAMDQLLHRVRCPVVCIPDIRYNNETTLCDLVVRVLRDDVPDTVGVAGHPSESGIAPDLIDWTINNNGTVPEFHKALDVLVAKAEEMQCSL